jgi:hypothetical protein
LSSLVQILEARFHREVSFLSLGGMGIYSSLSPPAAQPRWMPMAVGKVAEEIAAQPTGGGSSSGAGGGGGGSGSKGGAGGGGSGSNGSGGSGSGGGGGGGATGRWLQLQASCYDESLEEDIEVPTILYRTYV